MMLTIVEVGFR